MFNEKQIKYALTNFVLPIMLGLGLIGNLFCFIVYSRRRFSKFSLRFVFIVISTIDSFYLVLSLSVDYFNYSFDWDARHVSSISCVCINYLGYLIGPLSPWLLVYVSIERLVSISPYFHGFYYLKKKSYQIVYMVLILVFNLIFYSPVLFIIKLISNDDKITSNDSNSTNFTCDFIDLNKKTKFAFMDLANSTVVPALLMFLSTICIIYSIFKSSTRLFKAGVAQSRRRLHKDIKFAITSIFLNIVFITLNLPICIIYLDTNSFDTNSLKYVVSLILFYLTYSVNFYLFVFVNSMFRDEFLAIFRSKTLTNPSEISFEINRRTTVRKINDF